MSRYTNEQIASTDPFDGKPVYMSKNNARDEWKAGK